MTRREFATFLATLQKALPRFAPDMGDEPTVALWYEALGGLTTEQANAAYYSAIRTLDTFPSIRQLLELSGKGQQSDDDKAREVGERIWTAISKFGRYALISKRDKLHEYLGPIGVDVVRKQGGWEHVCELADDVDKGPTLKAQWRELAGVVVRKGRAGELDAPPDFAKLPEKVRANLVALDAKWGKS